MDLRKEIHEIKKLAKKMRKETGLQHCKCLDEIVKDLGYSCWNTYCAYVKEETYETSHFIEDSQPQEFQTWKWRRQNQ